MTTHRIFTYTITSALITLSILAAATQIAHAQDEPKAEPQAVETTRPAVESIYLEVGGSGIGYSLNYERLVVDKLALRGGLSYGYIDINRDGLSASEAFLLIPITVSYVGTYSGDHGLELSAGATLVYLQGSSTGGLTAFAAPGIGYRLHPVYGGLSFRVGAQFIILPFKLGLDKPTTARDWSVLPWVYMSAGYTF
jgi:hypothetical protein